jgi:hypothetical protein
MMHRGDGRAKLANDYQAGASASGAVQQKMADSGKAS